jgi:multidrug efflux pump subunit AcrB
MSIASTAVEKRAFTWFAIIVLLAAGAFSFTKLGQLEDPEFTVKTAVVTTTYPGATAAEVELEVTDRIEIALQEMPQLKNVYSSSRPGFSYFLRCGMSFARRSGMFEKHCRQGRASPKCLMISGTSMAF